MPRAVHTPRVNNNDDVVRLLRVLVERGDAVNAGDVVAEVETDKSSFTVEADESGFVLAVLPQVDDMIQVGSVLLWIGATPDEVVPDRHTPSTEEQQAAAPTVKAAQLLRKHGLRASDVRVGSGSRLTAEDVEAHIKATGLRTVTGVVRQQSPPDVPAVRGTRRDLTMEERGMLRTVLWQREEAVPGYVELEYDAAGWQQVAADYQQRQRLLLNPLLALMAYRLVEVSRQNPQLNSTIVNDQRFVYEDVNLGFTIQTETTLYLVVVENAAKLGCREFVDRLGELQRKASAHRLRPHECSGATIAFTSMARWNATRHIPVLPPHTALIVAHAAGLANGRGTLGATYDHRVLTGFDALTALSAVSQPQVSV